METNSDHNGAGKPTTSRRQKGLRRALLCGAAGLLCCTGIALATDPTAGFVTTSKYGPTTFAELHVVDAGDAKVQIKSHGNVDVWIVVNTASPGANSGWHTHPGPSLVTVQSGTATFYEADEPGCPPHMVQQGEGFMDFGGDHVHLVRNEGPNVLVLIATQVIPEAAPRRLPADQPLNCPVL